MVGGGSRWPATTHNPSSMFATDDAIVAIATPQGRGGIGVVRVSGASALSIAASILESDGPLQPRHATFTRLRAGTRTVLDEVVATFFQAPHSYTGQDVVEISAHGSPVVLNDLVHRALDAGARLAEPGEFTFRAYLNGKRDLVQAEAVADLIDAATPLQARVAFDQLDGTLTRRIGEIDADLFDLTARLEASLDFPDEGYHFIDPEETANRISAVIKAFDRLLVDASRGRMIREGATVVISGRTNVGKSSIFNALSGTCRAIVTDIHGTTRDLVTETIDIGGLAVTLVDTAGSRETADIVEREGVVRAARARQVAALVLIVLDGSDPFVYDDDRTLLAETAGQLRLVVFNKCDLECPQSGTFVDVPSGHRVDSDELVRVSAKTLDGIDRLRHSVVQALSGGELLRDTASMSNTRHIRLVEFARGHLVAAHAAVASGAAPEEFVLTDLQSARSRLDEIVGVRTTEDVLRHIFERFCIGK